VNLIIQASFWSSRLDLQFDLFYKKFYSWRIAITSIEQLKILMFMIRNLIFSRELWIFRRTFRLFYYSSVQSVSEEIVVAECSWLSGRKKDFSTKSQRQACSRDTKSDFSELNRSLWEILTLHTTCMLSITLHRERVSLYLLWAYELNQLNQDDLEDVSYTLAVVSDARRNEWRLRIFTSTGRYDYNYKINCLQKRWLLVAQ